MRQALEATKKLGKFTPNSNPCLLQLIARFDLSELLSTTIFLWEDFFDLIRVTGWYYNTYMEESQVQTFVRIILIHRPNSPGLLTDP